jgi:hypothetical protein
MVNDGELELITAEDGDKELHVLSFTMERQSQHKELC